jgi:RNA polymerase subunit RPABC4/transcription elongation factor Spt4
LISVGVSVLIVLLVIVGGLSALTSVSRPTASSESSSPPLTTAATVVHGNLIVPTGTTFVIQPTAGNHLYYQGGYILVEKGGKLVVLNVTLSFVQYVSDTGTAQTRLSHIYPFYDQGTVNFYNSTLTTDTQVINAYAKLYVNVTGSMTAWNTTFAFPGWVSVYGASADLTLNDSHVTGNPAISALTEPAPILGDTLYAPSIVVNGGAQLNAFGSVINNTYADNTLTYGHPGLVLGRNATVLNDGRNYFGNLSNNNGSATLAEDWLYPSANVQAGNLIVNWTNPNLVTGATISATVYYDGVAYPLTAANGATSWVLTNGQSGVLELPLSSSLLQAVTTDGVLNFLNWTGNFSAGPSLIAFNLPEASGPTIDISAELVFLPTPQYDMVVSGAGTLLNSVDSAFGLNWNAVPANATSQTQPFPWSSNKLLVTGGALALLANATVSSPIPKVFSYSAVRPDATSQAVVYRWAQFNVTGRGGTLPIPDAQVTAYYAYNSSTSPVANKTANAFNDLPVESPQIWGYVQYRDAQHGVSAYGRSNVTGDASVLLASSNLTGGTLPDGIFIGDYHVGVIIPAVGVGSHWLNWSVSPYPYGVAQTPPAVASPDFGPVQNFPGYFGGVSIESVTVLANGVASTKINLGQILGVKLVVEDIGTAPVTQVAGELYYNDSGLPSAFLASYQNPNLDLTTPGSTVTFTLTWDATANVTGLHPAFEHNLSAVVDWNYNIARLAGGNLSQNVSVTFEPTLLVIDGVAVLANGLVSHSSTVYLGETLGVQVTIEDVGNATIAAVAADLYYNATGLPVTLLATYQNLAVDLATPGALYTFVFSWKATENVTQWYNVQFTHDLSFQVIWNNNSADRWLGNGSLDQVVAVQFAPTKAFVASTAILANGVVMANATVDLGQTLGVQVVLKDLGNGTIAAVTAALYYNTSGFASALLASYSNTTVDLTGSGQSVTFTLSWKATENVTGLHAWFVHNLTLYITWNNNNNSRWLGNDSLSQNVTVHFAPSQIRFVMFSLPPTTLYLDQPYLSTGNLEYNGTHAAAIELIATPIGGGQSVDVAATTSLPGNFSMPWFNLTAITPSLVPGTTYTLVATASYNAKETNDTLLGTYSVPPTPPSSTNFFLQKFLGLPLWAWIAIAAAAAIAIVLFLFVVRRQAAGKLVECGECGNLIPEDATVCPKCGAEFESDLIRCSRCASTIPADSKFCPECAAQLLGTPGEAVSDPEKQAYADFTEKYRAEGKRELGDNYSEGAFWDWWKRQPTYTPFSQWSLQQGQGTARAGMTAPPVGTETTPEATEGKTPPKGGPGWAEGPPEGAVSPTPPPAAPTTTTPPAGAGLKACPSCGKEIPSEYLVCPFCNAVTS